MSPSILRPASLVSIAAVLALFAGVGCSNKSEDQVGGPRSSAKGQVADSPDREQPKQAPPAATAAAKAEPAPAPMAKSPARGEGDAKSGRGRRSGDAQPGAAPSPPPQDRPGLGTEWGETRTSAMTVVPFVRNDQTTPFATASLFYNDAQGARAMADQSGYRTVSAASFPVAQGAVTIGLRGENGRFLNGFAAGEREYAIGEPGQRYTIIIKNQTNARLECVVSVDGLDVIDGRAAGFAKRGYLVDPRGELEVDGFRQSNETVASFRFGSVRGSYASKKHGDTRNVGVIGVAIFNERGSNPLWSRGEVDRRHSANPFPGGFASPPSH